MIKVEIGEEVKTLRYKSVSELRDGIYLGYMDCIGGGNRLVIVCNGAFNVFDLEGRLNFGHSYNTSSQSTTLGNVTIIKKLIKEDWE